MARQMLRDCDKDLLEIQQCFHCYRRSNEKVSKHWFCKPCVPPHELVYAKRKGFPYWPAKVIKNDGESYDVRFFGSPHEKALIEKSLIRPISVNIHSLQVKRTSSWNKACEEMKRHQQLLEKLRAETNNFSRLADSSSDSEDEDFTPKKSSGFVPPVASAKFEKLATPTVSNEKLENSDSSSSETSETVSKKAVETKVEIPVQKRKPGRPPRDPNSVSIPKKPKKSPVSSPVDGLRKKRGRPRKVVEKEPLVGETSTVPLSTNKSSASLSLNKSSVPISSNKSSALPPSNKSSIASISNETISDKSEHVEHNGDTIHLKDAPSANRSQHEESKTEEEEMVSSSCQGVESPSLVQTKSIGIQTNLHDKKPSKDWINKMRLEFEMEEKRTIERLEKQHREAMELLREKHQLAITDVKKKQWCYNCEMEAIYHCCWNTSYCSTECQQIHWQREHKRVCRRKR